jgi:1-acyl-sn-glycerol-3-phosphate acyltransferase
MKIPGLYQLMRRIIGLGLGFYVRRIERFHPERVPSTGPVLFTSNHPNSLTVSFLVGATVGRKVNFVARAQLFQFKPLKMRQKLIAEIEAARPDVKTQPTV